LRTRKYPFDKLDDKDRYLIADQMFNGINRSDSYLISVTIDKEKHCRRYYKPVNPTGYGLYLMLERFQYFLEEHGDVGFAIFERFNSKMRQRVERVRKWLEYTGTFPVFTNFENIIRHVTNGDPAKEPLLQYADFFAYIPWIRSKTNYEAVRRWNEIKHKYYNLDHN
jgi:hypothetical protein